MTFRSLNFNDVNDFPILWTDPSWQEPISLEASVDDIAATISAKVKSNRESTHEKALKFCHGRWCSRWEIAHYTERSDDTIYRVIKFLLSKGLLIEQFPPKTHSLKQRYQTICDLNFALEKCRLFKGTFYKR